MKKFREDFNSIAPFETEKWNRNNHYHGFLLEKLPQNRQHILEIGCGIGTFSRLLSARAKLVTAMDLSPKMIEIAKNLSESYPNIDFQIADVLETNFPDEHFDAIVSIATFHHLPLEQVLPKLKRALKPGGRLLILDISRMESVPDFLTAAVAVPLGALLKIFHNGFARPTKAEREAWARHDETDCFLSFSEAKRIYSNHLENASVQRHLFFRYSVIWEK
ncbi:MAG TPA: class I SAM-dependent methyltransferase [Pyrinomonadaceae bacterium]